MLTTETCVSVVRTNRWKWLLHLDQKGKVAGVRVSPPKPRCPQDHPACSRQLKVLSSLASELGKSTRLTLHLDINQVCRRENASGRCGRRRQRSSQTISRNGMYMVKVRHPWPGGSRLFTMYLATLDLATSSPSLSSSPWMGGTPQRIFDADPPDQHAQLGVDLRSAS